MASELYALVLRFLTLPAHVSVREEGNSVKSHESHTGRMHYQREQT